MCNDNSWVHPQVHDFFTDRVIYAGMAIYGLGVTFKKQLNSLKCDSGVTNGHIVVTPSNVFANHAHHASEYTAFHYGFHRGLKGQYVLIQRLVATHNKHKDRLRWMALRGIELGMSDMFKEWHTAANKISEGHDYGEFLLDLYEKYKDESVPLPPHTWW